MKKIFSVLLSICMLAAVILPTITLAADPTAPLESCKIKTSDVATYNCPAKGTDCPYSSTAYNCGVCCILDTIFVAVNWIFVIVMALAVFMIAWAAFDFVWNRGEAAKVEAARQKIVFAAIGIVVALLARAIPAAVKVLIGG